MPSANSNRGNFLSSFAKLSVDHASIISESAVVAS